MITEIQKKIMEFSILDADEWVSNPFVNDLMIDNRIKFCFDDLKKYWLPILEQRNITIPDYPLEPTIIILEPITVIYADRILELKNSLKEELISLKDYKTETKKIEDEYKILLEQNQAENKANRESYLAQVKVINEEIATLIFSQPDYKSRAEREAKSPEELLQGAKDKKIQELELAYRNAQRIRVKNGHTFFVPLAGSDWVTIETACLSAQMRGVADLIWKDIDGNIQTLRDLPLVEWDKFYNTAKPIGVSNKDIRVRKEIEINNCQTQAELNTVVWSFPAITEVIVEI